MKEIVSEAVRKSMEADPQPLTIAGRRFQTRLFVVTGKFSSHEIMWRAAETSCSEMVTVALRRIDLTQEVPAQDPVSVLNLKKIVLPKR